METQKKEMTMPMFVELFTKMRKETPEVEAEHIIRTSAILKEIPKKYNIPAPHIRIIPIGIEEEQVYMDALVGKVDIMYYSSFSDTAYPGIRFMMPHDPPSVYMSGSIKINFNTVLPKDTRIFVCLDWVFGKKIIGQCEGTFCEPAVPIVTSDVQVMDFEWKITKAQKPCISIYNAETQIPIAAKVSQIIVLLP